MRIVVEGRAPLHGDYRPSGNSNAVLASIAAALLSDQPTRLHHIPNSHRTTRMLEIARHLGATISQDDTTLTIQATQMPTRILDTGVTSQLPVSTLFLAPMIAHRRHALLEWHEPISRLHTHITALRDLGQAVTITGNSIEVVGNTWQDKTIILAETSVTATALVCMLAAVLGQETTIYNAASEPHLRLLQHQLQQMGAKITGIGSNLLTIHGIGSAPRAADVIFPPDHIEIASIAAIAAICDGHVTIQDVPQADLHLILKVYERLGMDYFWQASVNGTAWHQLHIPEQSGLTVARRPEQVDVEVDTAPWPGFPSDLIAMATVLATQARGTTLIHEKLYNNRLLFIDKLKSMGAQILLCDPHRAIVIGKSNLRGEYIDSPDVRTGLALLGAALCAEGKTTIDNAEIFGYVFADVIDKLKLLGAQIKVVRS